MVLTIRLVILAFILEMGLCYSCRELSAARVEEETKISQFKTTGGDILTSGGLLGKGQPFEIIPEDEQKEITEEDSEESTDHSGIRINQFKDVFFNFLKEGKLSIRNHAKFYSLPLFLVFHSWKIHC